MLALNTPSPSGACSVPGRSENPAMSGPGGTSPRVDPLQLPGLCGKQRGTQKAHFLFPSVLSDTVCDRTLLPWDDFISLLSVMIQNISILQGPGSDRQSSLSCDYRQMRFDLYCKRVLLLGHAQTPFFFLMS